LFLQQNAAFPGGPERSSLEEKMRKTFLVAMFAVVLALAFAFTSACKMPGSVNDMKNMKLKGIAQTINLDKDELGKSIKTQWGSIKFTEKQVNKIKSLKSNKYVNYDLKSETNKNVTVVVTYLGADKFQLACTGF
jgi:hypothetical protein